jgi:hypothetical protein
MQTAIADLLDMSSPLGQDRLTRPSTSKLPPPSSRDRSGAGARRIRPNAVKFREVGDHGPCRDLRRSVTDLGIGSAPSSRPLERRVTLRGAPVRWLGHGLSIVGAVEPQQECDGRAEGRVPHFRCRSRSAPRSAARPARTLRADRRGGTAGSCAAWWRSGGDRAVGVTRCLVASAAPLTRLSRAVRHADGTSVAGWIPVEPARRARPRDCPAFALPRTGRRARRVPSVA